MLDLKNLISITPVPEEVKQQLIASADISADKKFEIENFCWEAIASHYEMKKKAKISELMNEVSEGKRKYSEEDIAKIDEEVFNEMNSKMEGLDTTEQIQEVREKLQQQTQTPKAN